MVPEECAGGAVDVCVQVDAEAAGVVPAVDCTSAFTPPTLVAVAGDAVAVAFGPIAVAPVPVAVCEAVAIALGETRGVVSAVGAV